MSTKESEAEIVERLRAERESVRAARPDQPVAVAITGGRHYTPTREDMARFWGLFEASGATVLRHGGCSGVDRYVASQVRQRRPDVVLVAHPAEWDRWGKAAGPRRNREMMVLSAALIAFPGDRGTRSCEEEARRLGRPVHRIQEVPVSIQVAHEHEVKHWWWSPARAVWEGRCVECCAGVIADRATAARLDRLAASS